VKKQNVLILTAGLVCLLLGVQGAGAVDIVVTNAVGTNVGTLAWAIDAANGAPGPDRILFQVPTVPANSPITISVNNIALPAITGTLEIDGTSQTSNECPPGVQLEGSGIIVLSGAHGLNIQASDCVIRGLVINRFPLSGIHIGNRIGRNNIFGCYIGTDTNGMSPLPNGHHGIWITNSPLNVIGSTPLTNCARRNIISGNTRSGVCLEGLGSAFNTLENNYIGLKVDGFGPMPNQWHGVLVWSNATDNNIGSTAAPKPVNVISGN